MDVTRRFWAIAGIGAFLAGYALHLGRPEPLVGAAMVWGWLVAAQYRFVSHLGTVNRGLTVDQSIQPRRTRTDEPVSVTLAVSLDRASPLGLDVDPGLPLAAEPAPESDRTVRLGPRDRRGAVTFTVSCPIAGVTRFAPATVRAVDVYGLFQETVERGSVPTLTVESRIPANLHIGEGGTPVAASFGEHQAGRIGAGLEPAELREYFPGDSAARIDWKATGRLNQPHVREFEAETDRMTVLLVDHRRTLAVGQSGETVLDSLRQVALAYLNSARERDDPLGIYAIGDEGVTVQQPPEATADRYAMIGSTLRTMEPTAPETERREEAPGGAGLSPAAARRAAETLQDDSAFATTLRPFLGAREAYVTRIESDPMFHGASSLLSRLRGSLWTVILTDDARPTEVRETVKIARRGDDHVIVFLAPRVLFEPGGLADIDEAYARYVAFEEFRRELAAIDRVSAFEVGPGDRLDALLATNRRREVVSSDGGVRRW